MRITNELTDEALLEELGRRVAHARLERNLTQRELAERSGMNRKAVQRIEAGAPTTTTSLVRVMRALGAADALDRLIPEPAPSPVELLQLRGRERRRASGSRGRRGRAARLDERWRWGDERPPAAS